MEYFRDRFTRELNDEGNIEIRGNEFTRHDVLVRMDPNAAGLVFDDWVEQTKLAAKVRARAFLVKYGSLRRFQRMTERYNGSNVVPFVGAGMSCSSGHLTWDAFLITLLNEAPDQLSALRQLLANWEFEAAAQLILDTIGSDAMNEAIANSLGRHRRRFDGPVNLLPLLFRQGVVTTNLDYVLPYTYEAAEHRFTREFCGSQIAHAAVQNANDPHCLIRLHGEAEVAAGRILTAGQYEEAYNDNHVLEGFLGQLVGLRSLLFLGCSLQTDRTLIALREIRAAQPAEPAPHYAFLPYPGDRHRQDRTALLNEASIYPIYYPPNEHDQSIEDLLITLLEGGLDD